MRNMVWKESSQGLRDEVGIRASQKPMITRFGFLIDRTALISDLPAAATTFSRPIVDRTEHLWRRQKTYYVERLCPLSGERGRNCERIQALEYGVRCEWMNGQCIKLLQL